MKGVRGEEKCTRVFTKIHCIPQIDAGRPGKGQYILAQKHMKH